MGVVNVNIFSTQLSPRGPARHEFWLAQSLALAVSLTNVNVRGEKIKINYPHNKAYKDDDDKVNNPAAFQFPDSTKTPRHYISAGHSRCQKMPGITEVNPWSNLPSFKINKVVRMSTQQKQ